MILFFDDELERVEPWIDALREQVDKVHPIRTAADLQAFLRQPPLPTLTFAVFDIMAPTGPQMDDRQTEYGSRTGLVLLDEFRRVYPRVPVYVLTNVRDETVMERVAGLWNVRVGRKRFVMPDDLVAQVREMLAVPLPP